MKLRGCCGLLALVLGAFACDDAEDSGNGGDDDAGADAGSDSALDTSANEDAPDSASDPDPADIIEETADDVTDVGEDPLPDAPLDVAEDTLDVFEETGDARVDQDTSDDLGDLGDSGSTCPREVPVVALPEAVTQVPAPASAYASSTCRVEVLDETIEDGFARVEHWTYQGDGLPILLERDTPPTENDVDPPSIDANEQWEYTDDGFVVLHSSDLDNDGHSEFVENFSEETHLLEVEEYDDDSDGEVDRQWRYTYDDCNFWVSREEAINTEGGFAVQDTFRRNHVWGDQGELLSLEEIYDDTGHVATTSWTYDDDLRVVTESYESELFGYVKEYTYDEDAGWQLGTFAGSQTGDFPFSRTYTYFYLDSLLVRVERDTDDDGTAEDATHYVYDDGRLQSETHLLIDDEGGELEQYVYVHTYDETLSFDYMSGDVRTDEGTGPLNGVENIRFDADGGKLLFTGVDNDEDDVWEESTTYEFSGDLLIHERWENNDLFTSYDFYYGCK